MFAHTQGFHARDKSGWRWGPRSRTAACRFCSRTSRRKITQPEAMQLLSRSSVAAEKGLGSLSWFGICLLLSPCAVNSLSPVPPPPHTSLSDAYNGFSLLFFRLENLLPLFFWCGSLQKIFFLIVFSVAARQSICLHAPSRLAEFIPGRLPPRGFHSLACSGQVLHLLALSGEHSREPIARACGQSSWRMT